MPLFNRKFLFITDCCFSLLFSSMNPNKPLLVNGRLSRKPRGRTNRTPNLVASKTDKHLEITGHGQ
jgi:hypothetical protein